MNRRRLSPRLRIQFVGLLMLLGLGSLIFKLWWVQVAHGAEWTSQLRGSSQATVRIPSVRGEIKDRNGLTLVQNRASYEVDFYLPEMVKGYRERFGSPPLAEHRAIISGMPKDVKEPDIIKIVNDGIVPRLEDLDLARDYNSKQLERHYRNDTEVPYSYIKDIDFPTMAKFSEHDVGLPGVDIAIKPVRSYVYGALASHILGYVGAPDDTNKEEARKFTFYQGDVEGKSNIERTMDEYLRGKPGVRYLKKNAKGTIEGVAKEEPPQQGANVYLTIDARIQAIADEALRAVSRAGAVVVDPNNGNVLALASVPSFDPNTFIPSIKAKDWQALRKDPADPLVNRAISCLPPGSTFKLITSLAGLRKGLTGNKYNCGGGVSYGDHFFQCWVASKHYTHGTIGLSDALKVSCDSFFYQYGNAAGIQSIDQVGKMLGIGEDSGLQLSGEQTGNMPGPEYRPFGPAGRMARFDVAPVIRSCVTLERPLARKHGVALKWQTSVESLYLYGDSGALYQVLTNLIRNAVDASTGEKSTVFIALDRIGDSLSLTVRDSGRGIAPELRSRIFDRGFTTKPPGKGSGIGLAVVKEITEAMFGGTIDVESRVGVGSTFTLTLPIPPQRDARP